LSSYNGEVGDVNAEVIEAVTSHKGAGMDGDIDMG